MKTEKALHSLELFSKLPESALKQIAQFSKIRPMRAGETIFCQGEPSPYCFGILSGEVLIQRVARDRRFPPKILSALGPGSLFGESSFFEESPRAAMASASQDGELLAITGTTLRQWLASTPTEGQFVLLGMLENALSRLQQTSGDLSIIYGVSRILGGPRPFEALLPDALEFLKNSIEHLGGLALYRRNPFWEEFAALVTLPHAPEVLAIPTNHLLVHVAQASPGALVVQSQERRAAVSDLKLGWPNDAAVALVPLVDRESSERTLQGLFLFMGDSQKEVFSPNTLLLLATVSDQFSEALSRHDRFQEREAQARLQDARRSLP